MASSKMKDKLENNKWNKVLEFIKQNVRYFTAGALFIALVVVLVNCGTPNTAGDGQVVNSTEIETETEQAFEVDAHQEVNDLINRYYAAYSSGNVDEVTSCATPVSENEKSYIEVFSQYVDAYQGVKCYTKQGLDANSYLVSVYVEIKFTGVETAAPGLDFFYVRTNEDGTLYIDNLYSQYNLKIKESALDTSIQSLIGEFENSEDVKALQQEVQAKYDTAVASDEKLAEVITTTLPNAITEWAGTIVSESTENVQEETEGTETLPEETETPDEEVPQEEVPEEKPEVKQETVYALDTVNVRAEADTDSERLGSLAAGAAIARTGTEGEWSVVDFGGQTGYIKTEFLTTDSSQVEETAEEGNEDTHSNSIAEGTVITLDDSVNIRSGMSETADKIGTAYSGEKVTVIMSYAEGWTKVNWNNKTGYIKTSLLQ